MLNDIRKENKMNNAITPEKNTAMRILTGIAILLVMCGHLDLQTFTIFDLFPYYSFHVLIFVFISGYFYKEENEEHLLKYIGKKAAHLLGPYFIWNILYGILVTCLHKVGFGFGENLSIKTLFIQPFVDGHQYMLNFASWFVPALFLLHVINVLGRRMLGLLIRSQATQATCSQELQATQNQESQTTINQGRPHFPKHDNEPLEESDKNATLKGGNKKASISAINKKALIKEATILSASFLLGIATIYLAIAGHVWGYWKLPGRILFMLPVYEMGIVYKKYLEKYASKIPDLAMLAVVVGIQLVVRLTCKSLVFSAVWCSGFNNGPIIPYITIITGLVFWYRIAKILTRVKLGQAISYIGDMSFSLMMHHTLAFFLINSFAYYMYQHHPSMGYELFDTHRYLYSVDYVYWIYDLPATKWLYLIVGLMFSALLYKAEKAIKRLMGR